MKSRDYDKLISSLKEFSPDSRDREINISRIMEKTATGSENSEKAYNFLFWWLDITWIRRSVIFASILIIAFFALQQFTIISRIGNLENRMIGISTENILESRKESVKINATILKASEEINLSDSIKVAREDLNSLVRSYKDLQKRYNELQEEIRNNKSIVPINPGLNNKINL